jgi:hypothetical protein
MRSLYVWSHPISNIAGRFDAIGCFQFMLLRVNALWGTSTQRAQVPKGHKYPKGINVTSRFMEVASCRILKIKSH